ncbi:MAG: hypothetical protein WCJ39_04185 [bacterium]
MEKIITIHMDVEVYTLLFYHPTMLFDFQAFIEELREKAEKKQIVEKYETLF